MEMDMDEAIQGMLDASDPRTPWPGENRSAVYRHCFEVRRREMNGNYWTAEEARQRATKAYIEDGREVPEFPHGRPVR